MAQTMFAGRTRRWKWFSGFIAGKNIMCICKYTNSIHFLDDFLGTKTLRFDDFIIVFHEFKQCINFICWCPHL